MWLAHLHLAWLTKLLPTQEINLVASDLALELIADVSCTLLLSPRAHFKRKPKRGLAAWTDALPAHAFEVCLLS